MTATGTSPEQNKSARRGRRWLYFVAIAAILAAATLVATPMVARQQLERWLLANGADEAVIENIDFNPFYGTFALRGMDVRLGGRTVISDSDIFVDLGWKPLLGKGVVVEQARLEAVTLEIEQREDGSWRIGSLVIPSSEDAGEQVGDQVREEIDWWFGLENLELKNARVDFRTPRVQTVLEIEDMVIERFDTRPGQRDSRTALNGRLDGAPLRAEIKLVQHAPFVDVTGSVELDGLELANFAPLVGEALEKLAGRAQIDGAFALKYGEGVENRLTFDGAAGLGNLDVGFPGLLASGESLAWKGDLNALLPEGDKGWSVDLDGELASKGLSIGLAEDALSASAGVLGWRGRTRAAGEAGAPRVELEGRLEGGQVAVSLPRENLAVGQEGIEAELSLKLDLAGEVTGLAGGGDLALAGLRVEDTAKRLVLLAADSLQAKGVEAAGPQKAQVAGIVLDGVGLVRAEGAESPSVAAGRVTADGLAWSDASSVGLEKVVVDSLAAAVVLESDGSVDLLNALQAGDGASNAGGAAATESAVEAPVFRLGELSLTEGGVVTFEDRGVDPVFKSRLDIASFSLREIDTGRPEHPMPVELEGKLNNYGTLTAKGTAVPFAEQPAVDLEIALRGQDMVNVSPYMIAATGYRFTAGLLDVDSRVVVKDGSIDAQNSLLIKKLQVKEVDKAISAQSAGSIGMPLDAALGILTDKNGSIELDVPIQGKLDEVDVGLQSVINIALQKATTVGLKTYLVYAFQPYGAAILLAEAVGGQMGKISLDPIVFDAGTSALTASHEDYLARLGKVMQERPQIVVQVCGLTATADLGEAPAGKEGAALSEEQAARMAELAQAREAAVKEHMISTYGVDAGRLVPCAPEHDGAADAKPRVVLTL